MSTRVDKLGSWPQDTYSLLCGIQASRQEMILFHEI